MNSLAEEFSMTVREGSKACEPGAIRRSLIVQAWDQVWRCVSHSIWGLVADKLEDPVDSMLRVHVRGHIKEQLVLSGWEWAEMVAGPAAYRTDTTVSEIFKHQLWCSIKLLALDTRDRAWVRARDNADAKTRARLWSITQGQSALEQFGGMRESTWNEVHAQVWSRVRLQAAEQPHGLTLAGIVERT